MIVALTPFSYTMGGYCSSMFLQESLLITPDRVRPSKNGLDAQIRFPLSRSALVGTINVTLTMPLVIGLPNS